MKAWIRQVQDLMGSKHFFFSDLPEELQNVKELNRAKSRGYITVVEKKFKRRRSGTRLNVWQVMGDRIHGKVV